MHSRGKCDLLRICAQAVPQFSPNLAEVLSLTGFSFRYSLRMDLEIDTDTPWWGD